MLAKLDGKTYSVICERPITKGCLGALHTDKARKSGAEKDMRDAGWTEDACPKCRERSAGG